jgi:hypothetical protein
MMAPRILVCCLAALALAGCGGEQEAGDDGGVTAQPPPTTQLTVRVDPDGDGPEQAEQARISCGLESSGRGSLCAAAEQLRPAAFEPTPDDVACTELFGGPQTATISGTLAGEQVDGRFSRQDGCEIARWEKVSALLAEAGR